FLLYISCYILFFFFFFQAEDGIRDLIVTGVQTCALPISELAQKAVWTECCGELGVQHLDGYFAMVLQVLGEVDGRHPAVAELALEVVAVGYCSSQLLKWIRQRRLPGSGDSHHRVPSPREPAGARPPEPKVPRSNRGWRTR